MPRARPWATTLTQAVHAFHQRCAIASAAVAAPGHPPAKIKGTVSRVALSKHVQLVLADRSSPAAGREFGVMSPLAWRHADPGARHAFLRDTRVGQHALYMVELDLADGRLLQLRLKTHPLLGTAFSVHAAWLKDQPPGPARSRFVDQFEMRFDVMAVCWLTDECAIACLSAKK